MSTGRSRPRTRAGGTGSTAALAAALLLSMLIGRTTTAATTAATSTPVVSATPSVPSLAALPGGDDQAIAALWRRALEAEAREDDAAAAATYEEIAAQLPHAPEPRWRAARSHWDRGRRLPAHDVEGRRSEYRLTVEWAERGLEVDPQCGECCLFKAAGIGGEVRDRSAAAGAIQVSEIAALLERGIAIMERKPDADRNQQLESLYYAAAQLYREVPDSSLLRWVLRVPGDRRRAIEYMRRAYRLDGSRPDRGIELAALLLCTGDSEGDPLLESEGRELLRAILARPDDQVAPQLRNQASALLASPDKACEFKLL